MNGWKGMLVVLALVGLVVGLFACVACSSLGKARATARSAPKGLDASEYGLANAPATDLESVLESSQGGGGGGGSTPFVENLLGKSGEPAARSGRIPDQLRLAQSMAAIPGAMPSLDEEIWVIQKPSDWDAARPNDIPGSGSLLAGFEPDTPTDLLVPVPLKHTDVRAHVGGLIASTVVTQTFENPYSSKIEAVYVFPLPQNAAVNEFVMTIGERRIRGIIRDKAEAEQIYQEARSQGYVASLLTQERPNVFTQKVANIEPGRAIDVAITYFHTLPYRDGSFEYVFPMVVGPRFNPPPSEGFAAGAGIGAAPRGEQGVTGQATEVQYLAPDERSGHDVFVEVDIDAGVPLGGVACKSHSIAVRRDSETRATVQLAGEATIANEDFVLRFTPQVEQATPGMITWIDPESGIGYFAMLVVPPAELTSLPRRPMEIVFVVDASGSMSGVPIEQAKAAVRAGLGMLEPQDTFQLINFSNTSSQLGPRPLAATHDSTARAERYLNQLVGAGGTMMINGIRASLDFPHDGERTRFVCFLTDGFIGNEAEFLGEMRSRLNGAHVFSFGVGSSPNRYLIERMAKLGEGAVAYLSPEDDGGEVMADFFERAARPALADLAIEWPALEAAEVYPASLPDVYVGRPIVITGRFDPALADTPVRLTGAAGQVELDIDVPVTVVDDDALARGLRAVWARGKIAALMDEATYEPNPTLAGDVRTIALEHSLMSAFTAFIAVDSSRVTEGSSGTSVAAPVRVPEGVRYNTTVPSGG